MNRLLVTASALSALFLLSVAGCSAPTEEESAESGDALTAGIIDEPAVAPTGAAPKVLAIDWDLSHYDSGAPDYSGLKIDVLDTSAQDPNRPSLNLKWVESDKKQLPKFVDTISHGIDVGGGGKCRITTLSLKKVAVGCKWTW